MLESMDEAFASALSLPAGDLARFAACLDEAISENLSFPEYKQRMARLSASMTSLKQNRADKAVAGLTQPTTEGTSL